MAPLASFQLPSYIGNKDTFWILLCQDRSQKSFPQYLVKLGCQYIVFTAQRCHHALWLGREQCAATAPTWTSSLTKGQLQCPGLGCRVDWVSGILSLASPAWTKASASSCSSDEAPHSQWGFCVVSAWIAPKPDSAAFLDTLWDP